MPSALLGFDSRARGFQPRPSVGGIRRRLAAAGEQKNLLGALLHERLRGREAERAHAAGEDVGARWVEVHAARHVEDDLSKDTFRIEITK